MSLEIRRVPSQPVSRRLALCGSLDNDTAVQLQDALEEILAEDFKVLIFDMAELDYISSAGIREIFLAVRTMKDKAGRVAVTRLRPQIRQVFKIVKALPDMSVFASYEEMDEYLDAIQKQALDKE